MRICILEHEPECPPGYLADWAAHRGHSTSIVEVPRLSAWPEPGAHDLIVSLGSDRSVHGSPDPWIADEIGFIQAATTASVPVLGICFGAQLLAAALGGRARRAAAPRAEWLEIDSAIPDLIPVGPWFRWHEDAFELPPGGRLLAGTAAEPLAFAIGTSVGLQFHPEVGRQLAEEWIEGGREQLQAQRIDEHRLRRDVDRHAPEARNRAFCLFDRLASFLIDPPRTKGSSHSSAHGSTPSQTLLRTRARITEPS